MSFEFEYRGIPLTTWMESGHPALQSMVNKVTSNTLAWEFDACAKMGIDPYVQIQTRPRDWRAAIVAHHAGRDMTEAMRYHDSKPKPKPGKKK